MAELTISTVTFLKIFLIGCGTYILLPVLMALRDLIVIEVIERFIVTEKVELAIWSWAESKWNLDYPLNKSHGYKVNDEEVLQCNIEDNPVLESEYKSLISKREFHERRLAKLESKLMLKKNLIYFLIKHYKIDQFNPIAQMMKDSYKHYEINSGSDT